jgi:tetratricopeptide (TPR) repeat protein
MMPEPAPIRDEDATLTAVFGGKAKIRKAVARAFASVIGDDDVADLAPIEALPANVQASAYALLARELVDDERYVAAHDVVERALALAPDDVALHRYAATIHRERGDVAAAIAALERVVAADPRAVPPARELAQLLIKAAAFDDAIALVGRFADDRDRELEALRAEALFLRGDSREALAILDEVCARYEAELREPWSTTDRHGLIARAEDARRLRADVYAELHGREATIELAAAAGRLDARAGVNYRLLGARLASKSAYVPATRELEDPDATERRGQALGMATSTGLVHVGAARLRRGDYAGARSAFERATELDGGSFAAFFGLGAALDHDKYELHRRAERLPLPPRAGTIEAARVVVDWPALTELERRVVWASVAPVATLLPRLAERGVTMRVLPIDVRATDVGLFEHVAGKRARDDHRSYDALAGVATHAGAIAKIEELLDIASPHAWTFAHELAHLVYFHLDEARAAPFRAIYERARAVGYATTAYALKNDDELFAVSYTEYLGACHGGRDVPEADDAGVRAALSDYFRALCDQ